MRSASVEALVTVTWTFFCCRTAPSGVSFLFAESTPEGEGAEHSSRLTRILMGPRATSKRSFSTSRCTTAILFIDLRRTWSPVAMCFKICGWALASPNIGAGAVCDDGLVEALLKLAAQALDAAFGFLRQFLLRGAIFDGADRLAHLELEVLEQ